MNKYVDQVRSLAGGLSKIEEAKARDCYCTGKSIIMAALYITKARES